MSETPESPQIIPVNIETQMQSAYIDYSMSVIVSRALPDVRDGLKPVHRRVLFGMREIGVMPNAAHKKSARIVGEVLGKYHPHGDVSVYDAMVRMAQSWSLRYTLIDGQGNFGSVDGDSPAAMRYTEARFKKIAVEMMRDLEKETVDWQLNFDDSLKEPTVLPSYFPNLLVNGGSGIAVGMATNMPPHNLTEVINGIIAFIDNPEIKVEELLQYITGPDFPTGGTIFGTSGIEEAYRFGKGRVVVRGKYNVEEVKGREQIVFTEIPYQVNKAEMIKKIASLVQNKNLEGISMIRDESDRKGMRIVFQLKQDAISNLVVNNLFKSSALQSSFNINNIALVKGRPKVLGLVEIIFHFVEHRHDVLVRRTNFELLKAEKEAHILEGLLIALDNLDAIIKLIRASHTVKIAKDELIFQFKFTDLQAKAVLDMTLQRLTGLERDKIRKAHATLLIQIEEFKRILGNRDLRMSLIKEDLLLMKEKYGDSRRTNILQSSVEVNMEDLISDEEVVITISKAGYIKRTLLEEYKTQSRGGTGSKGATTRIDDVLEHIFMSSNHSYLLLFTAKGKCYCKKTYEITEGSKISKGRAIQNLIQIDKDDVILAYVPIKNLKDESYVQNKYILTVTKKGIVKKTPLSEYMRLRQDGRKAIIIRDNDTLLSATLTNGAQNILLATKKGKAIHFSESQIRSSGRNSSGVKAIQIIETDEVIGMICVDTAKESPNILVISENGYGKRSKIEDYRITKRGGKGIKTINITEKTGDLLAIQQASDEEDLLIITDKGTTIRFECKQIRVIGRASQGVKLINLKNTEKIASITSAEKKEL